MVQNGYEQSVLISKLKKRQINNKPLRIAFLDIDSTMTGRQNTTDITRAKLEKLGYAIVYVTARTEEMLMSSSEYNKSKKNYHFTRPVPLLGFINGKHNYVKPELIEPKGLLDPDIIAGSTGTQILIRQNKGGYMLDDDFEQNMYETNEEWRQRVMNIIHQFNKLKKKAFLAHYDTPRNYHEGLSDIYQPKYRVTVAFQSGKDKLEFRSFVKHFIKTNPTFINIRLIDDSEPRKEHFVFYITPKNGGKRKAVDHIIHKVCTNLAVKPNDLHVFIAGDGHADFEMGMRAAAGTCVTFLLAAGSRLMPALRCKNDHPELLDEKLEELKTEMRKSNTKGFYKSFLDTKRHLILYDEVEKEKIAVDGIYSHLLILEDKQIN